MKIVFLGTPKFVDCVLDALKEEHEVLAIRNPQDFNDEKIGEIKKFSPDLFVVASFGVILSSEVLNIPKLGAINIHPSLLPKYRGPSPIQTTILSGDKTTGVTIIKMDEEVDHGPILWQKEVKVLGTETFVSLAEKLFNIASGNLNKTITNYVSNETMLTKQDDSKATFTQHLTRFSGFIDLQNPPSKVKLERMIMAHFPWPGVWTKFNLGGKERSVKFLPDGKVQVEGKREMNYKDFMNGYQEGENLLRKLSLI